MEVEEEVSSIRTVVIVGCHPPDDAFESRLRSTLSLSPEIVYSEDGSEYHNREDVSFVLSDFEGPSGPLFKSLSSSSSCIYGRTAMEEILLGGPRVLSRIYRPLFSHSMAGLILCFSGYRQKEELKHFLFMVHSMGGSVRKDFVSKVTHLVSADCSGEKYRFAATFDIPIVSKEWLIKSWEKRHEPGFKATDPAFIEECKVKPFQGAKIYFYGVPDNGEKERMVKELERNGGVECKDYKTEPCTHLVVDETGVTGRPPDVQNETYVVKSEWFWVSIQMDSCADEKIFRFLDHTDSLLSPKYSGGILSPTTPGSQNRKRKRQNRKDIVNELANPDPLPQFLTAPSNGSTRPGRRSSVGDVAMLSMSGSFLDTPDIFGKDASDPTGLHSPPPTPQSAHQGSSAPLPSSSIPKIDISQMSPRQQVFMELVQTESNYVNILKTIIEVFKKPLEDPDKIEGQFLNATETKIIFGNLPPIFALHSQMLADFTTIISDWKDDVCIGNVFLKYADDLEKTYPPFVNFFETTKNCLQECSNAKPRFHAFLKVCQTKPECGRQTLTELLIRPVQRLPSISLLLNDLLKHTRKEKDHPDSSALEKALNKIKAVMTHINEDKRRTECQMHIFDIFNDIENCPPHLVSSHRNFFLRAEVLEIGATDELCGKGYDLSLFLFSDVLEIAKKRSTSKGLGFRSPSALSLTNPQGGHGGMSGSGVGVNGNGVGVNPGPGQGQHHSQKHVELMNLTSVKRVVDVPDSDEYQGIFALVCRSNQELKERMFIFQLTSPDIEKIRFLKILCRNIANTMCRPDPDTYLTRRRPEELELEPSDLNVSNMSRAYVKLHRTKQKVGRAFSFNKTPTNALKRAVSSMISPLANRERINSTPSGDLQAMRLSSCSNLLSAESPRSSRGGRFFSSPSKGSCVKTSTVSLHSADSASSPQKDGSFTIPRTPQQPCSRRPSFKFKSKTLSKKF